jgi:anti-sigma factor RsiW
MHFSEQPWADFVRGVSEPKISKEIRAHQASGCPECKKTHEAWSRIRRLATDEGAYAPPENLVRLAKLGFASKAAPPSRTWTLANLVFDSFAQPLPAGVRSGALNVWQVIYEAEGLAIDLRFGRRAQSKAVHVVGQVFDKLEARALQNNASIELLTDHDQMIAAAPVTALGEFHLEFEHKEPLWLSVRAVGRNPLRIPLTEPK